MKTDSVAVPTKKYVYKDFRETCALDCGLPVFITYDGKYSFARTIDEFIYGIENLNENYFLTTTVKTFKDYFKSLAKYFKYPKDQAEKVLHECLAKISPKHTATC